MASAPAESQLDLKESDLKDQCYRLNRRFTLLEDQVAKLSAALAAMPSTATAAAPAAQGSRPENPVNLDNLNLPPGQTSAPIPASPAVAYGPSTLRLSDYDPAVHVGQLFVESDTGKIWQSQIVGNEATWVSLT